MSTRNIHANLWALASLAAVMIWAVAAVAADWPQFLGQSRNGSSAETGLLTQWPDEGPPLVWKISGLGEGYSDVSVAQGRIFTMGQHGKNESVMALDAATGKMLWQVAITDISYSEGHGNGPRGTPTVDGDRVYAEAADGTLVCLEAKTGKKIWSVNFQRDFHANQPHWAFSESPLVEGEDLIATPGAPDATIVALDKNNGKVVWKSPIGDSAGYASPIVAQVGDVRQFIQLTAQGVVGVRVSDGKLLWRYDKVANRTANIATPIFRDPYVFVSTEYGTGCALLKLTNEGGTVKATEVYFNRDMQTKNSNAVIQGNWLYGFNHTILTAMNLMTGEVAWKDRSVGDKGSVTIAEGKLYVLGENGNVALVDATPEGYKEISRFSIEKSNWPAYPHLVISNGKMFLREEDNLFCFNIRKLHGE
jgi:outer membrane protein assembly factor BamB